MTKAPKKRKRERKHALPAEATDDDRLLALAKRLYTGTNAKAKLFATFHCRVSGISKISTRL